MNIGEHRQNVTWKRHRKYSRMRSREGIVYKSVESFAECQRKQHGHQRPHCIVASLIHAIDCFTRLRLNRTSAIMSEGVATLKRTPRIDGMIPVSFSRGIRWVQCLAGQSSTAIRNNVLLVIQNYGTHSGFVTPMLIFLGSLDI